MGAFYSLDYCKSCYCLRALRQLDCPNGVAALPGYVNDDYLKVDMGGSTADCAALQHNFPMVSIVDCMQIGRSGSGTRSAGAAIDGGGFNWDTLWGLLSLLLFVIILYVVYWVKKWRMQRAARMAEGLPVVAYRVTEPSEGEAEAPQQQQPELPGVAQQLAIEPAPTNMPLEPLIIYDLLG